MDCKNLVLNQSPTLKILLFQVYLLKIKYYIVNQISFWISIKMNYSVGLKAGSRVGIKTFQAISWLNGDSKVDVIHSTGKQY